MIITITGTPGTGKTYIAKKITAWNKNLKYIDLNAMIKKEKLYDSYDKSAKTYDVDEEKIKKLDKLFKAYNEKNIKAKKIVTLNDLKQKISNIKGVIIDSHLSHFLNSNLCIVVKADIKIINNRLKKRKYDSKKIRENIESEIFDVCLEEARQLNRNIAIIYNN